MVEDNDSIREAVLEMLRDEGITAIGVSDGAMAIVHLRGAPSLPSVILTDLMMPRLDGWALIEAVRGDALLRQIRIVMMTASPFASAPMGVRIVRKPFHITTLLEALDEP